MRNRRKWAKIAFGQQVRCIWDTGNAPA